MKSGNIDFIYKNELDKACFQHDMAYGKSKDLIKRTQSDKGLRDKALKIASNPKCDGFERGLASMVYKLFYKKTLKEVVLLMSLIINYQVNYINLLLKKLKKRKVYSSFKVIYGVDI